MDPDEHEQSAEMRDPVLRPRALRYSVAYVPMPEDVAGRYMHRKGREEDAYRAACGREFHLDLFPPRLKVRPSLFYCFPCAVASSLRLSLTWTTEFRGIFIRL